MPSPENLYSIATKTRKFLEPFWCDWHAREGHSPIIPSQGTCGRSSLFLHYVFNQYGIISHWMTGNPVQNNGTNFYGYHDGGKWHAHSWIIVDDWIIDITADQFGPTLVFMTDSFDSNYRAGSDFASAAAQQLRIDTAKKLLYSWKN